MPQYSTTDPVHGSLLVGTLLGVDMLKTNLEKQEKMRKLMEDAARAKEENKNDRIDPNVKPETPAPSKPVDQTPAKPTSSPVQTKVNPDTVNTRPEVPGTRER